MLSALAAAVVTSNPPALQVHLSLGATEVSAALHSFYFLIAPTHRGLAKSVHRGSTAWAFQFSSSAVPELLSLLFRLASPQEGYLPFRLASSPGCSYSFSVSLVQTSISFSDLSLGGSDASLGIHACLSSSVPVLPPTNWLLLLYHSIYVVLSRYCNITSRFSCLGAPRACLLGLRQHQENSQINVLICQVIYNCTNHQVSLPILPHQRFLCKPHMHQVVFQTALCMLHVGSVCSMSLKK